MPQGYPMARKERPRSSSDEDFSSPARTKKRPVQTDPKVDLMMVQLILCAIALLGVFALKFLGGEVYRAVKEKYVTLVCDRTSVHQVVEALSHAFSENEEEAVSSTVAEGGSDENTEPYVENYQSVAQEIHQNEGNINDMSLPLKGTLTSPFARRIHPITGKLSMHGGVDIAAESGSEIVSAMDGVVRRADSDESSGNYLILDHNESLATVYAHCQELLVSEGEWVEKGQVIALVGSTGLSTGPHLHFEVRLNGAKLNPEWILDFTADS